MTSGSSKEEAPFPPPPWKLAGSAVAALWLVDTKVAKRFVPSGIGLVCVLPGKSVGGLLLARYGEGSTLPYNELIVFTGVVRKGWRVGGWISHIYVDDPASVSGGRHIWGLPKELAEFQFDGKATVVRQAAQTLVRLEHAERGPIVPVPLWMPAWGERHGQLLQFSGRGMGRAQLGRASWETPPTSPLAEVMPRGGGRCFALRCLDLTVSAPQHSA
jgi:acetoacetate decarboxylase